MLMAVTFIISSGVSLIVKCDVADHVASSSIHMRVAAY